MPKFIIFPLFLCLALSSNASNDFVDASKAYKLDARILWAIAYKESRHTPHIISKSNKNGSYDIGIMQINSSHLAWLKDYGISEQDLRDNPRINIFVGAFILRQCFDKHAPLNQHTRLVNAISCYNGRVQNNPYGKEVLQILERFERQNNKRLAKQRAKNYFKAEKERLFVKAMR